MFYLLGIIIGLVISFLITAVLIWILAMCFGFMFTGSLGYLSDYQEHFYKKLRRINNNGKHL